MILVKDKSELVGLFEGEIVSFVVVVKKVGKEGYMIILVNMIC